MPQQKHQATQDEWNHQVLTEADCSQGWHGRGFPHRPCRGVTGAGAARNSWKKLLSAGTNGEGKSQRKQTLKAERGGRGKAQGKQAAFGETPEPPYLGTPGPKHPMPAIRGPPDGHTCHWPSYPERILTVTCRTCRFCLLDRHLSIFLLELCFLHFGSREQPVPDTEPTSTLVLDSLASRAMTNFIVSFF